MPSEEKMNKIENVKETISAFVKENDLSREEAEIVFSEVHPKYLIAALQKWASRKKEEVMKSFVAVDPWRTKDENQMSFLEMFRKDLNDIEVKLDNILCYWVNETKDETEERLKVLKFDSVNKEEDEFGEEEGGI